MPVLAQDILANAVTKVMNANPNRVAFTVRNDSAADVYFGYDRTVAISGAQQGIKVKNTGGQQEDEWHKGPVYVISGSSITVNLIENIKDEGLFRVRKAAAEE